MKLTRGQVWLPFLFLLRCLASSLPSLLGRPLLLGILASPGVAGLAGVGLLRRLLREVRVVPMLGLTQLPNYQLLVSNFDGFVLGCIEAIFCK